jgi:hypothetical protein
MPECALLANYISAAELAVENAGTPAQKTSFGGLHRIDECCTGTHFGTGGSVVEKEFT